MSDNLLERKRLSLISVVSLGAALLVAGQIILIIVRGEAFCFNDGCKTVERLTTISPLLFNAAGLGYFLILLLLARFARVMEDIQSLLNLLLLAGMTVESVLFSYQQYVAKTFCSYCLVLLGCIFILNLLAGFRQFFVGAALVASIHGAFSALSFDHAVLLGKTGSIPQGSIGITKIQEKSTTKYFLFFSKDCPHCGNVIIRIPEYSLCEIHLNPIDDITSLNGIAIEQKKSYLPEINRLFLALLQIDAVPVLFEKGKEESHIFKGDRSILGHLDNNCIPRNKDELSPAKTLPQSDQSGMSSLPREEINGECNLREECRN